MLFRSLRFKLDGKFYTTFAFSFIWGSVYHDYDENVKDGIFDTTNGTYLNEGAINPDESDKIEKTAATNDYALNKKNTVLSIAADLGYKANENIGFGLMAQFVFSSRFLFNPVRIDEDNNTHIDANGKLNSNGDGDLLRFLRDGSTNFWGSSNYNTWGIFAAPYAKLYMFDIMARVSYNKAPYLYKFLEDSSNSTLAFNLDIVYNFCDYGSLALVYTFIREDMYKYDKDYNAKNGYLENEYIKDVFNHNMIMLNLTVNYDFLWEKN